MNKTELVSAIAKKADISKTAAACALDAVMSAITETLAKKDSVVLVGFGSFSTSKRKARTGRDPRSGKAINIPARTVPKFKAGKQLKDAVDKSKK
ncbi:MAG: DNA-binding protein HU [Gammaproteobacteria bacterium GWE2_37_16]|nr:MAG: DNA-binding protein HU [Gammaproteobacteria bacterium GWE2_37_16]